MNIFQKIKKGLDRSVETRGLRDTPKATIFTAPRDVSIAYTSYFTSSVLRAQVDALVAECLSFDYEITGEDEVLGRAYFETPNYAGDSTRTFSQKFFLDLLVANVSAARVLKNDKSIISGIYLLDPTLISGSYQEDLGIVEVTYNGSVLKKGSFLLEVLQPTSSKDKPFGASVVSSVLEESAGMSASTTYLMSEMVTQGVPPGVLIVRGLRGEAADRFWAALQETLVAQDGNPKIELLSGGINPDEVKFIPLAPTAAQVAQAFDSLERSIKEYFLYPDKGDSVYLIKTKDILRQKRYIIPCQEALAHFFNTFYKDFLKIDATLKITPVQTSAMTTEEVSELLHNGILSLNEARAKVGLSPVEEDVRTIVSGQRVYRVEGSNVSAVPIIVKEGGDINEADTSNGGVYQTAAE